MPLPAQGSGADRSTAAPRGSAPGGAAVARTLGLAGAAAVGVLVALAGLVVHRHTAGALPWGLLLVLLTAYAMTVAAGLLVSGGAWAAAAGFAVVILFSAGRRGEGDYLVAADTTGYALLVGGLVAVGAGLLTASRSAAVTRNASGPDRTLES